MQGIEHNKDFMAIIEEVFGIRVGTDTLEVNG